MQEFFTQIIFSLSKFSQQISSFDLFKPGGAVLIVIFFVVVVFLVSFSLGKTRLLIGILSIYIAAFLQSIFPFTSKIEASFGGSDWLGLPVSFWLSFVVFVVAFLTSLFLLNRSILKPKMSLQESSAFTILFLSILVSGFLFSIVMSYLPSESISLWLLNYFGNQSVQFVWAVLPLLALLFLRKKRAF